MPDVKELKAKATELRKTLATIDKLTGGAIERERDLERKREQRAAGKEVFIPPCEDRERRERLEANDVAWLMYYFGSDSGVEGPFTYEFTDQQLKMIEAIRSAIVLGDDAALAASRGEGKTTIFERMLTKYTLQGVLSFSVLLAATGALAEDSLDSIKCAIEEENDLLLADYPEVCVPVRALENTPNRAHYQTVSGNRHDNGKPFRMSPSRFSWCGWEIVFPKVPGSPSSRAIIATRGLDSALRGLKKKGRRVDLVGIDDPDTEETVRSPEQAKKLETRIDRAIAWLGGQKRRVARVMLTTLQNRTCVSYKFTDPKQKPSWNGKRFRFLVKRPDRPDLWEEYVQLRQVDWQKDTTAAHEFYVANRDAMDVGAIVANPNRYTPGELSALQFYYNEVARTDAESVATELDNDPPEEIVLIESGITPHRIQKKVNGYARKAIPTDCTLLTQGIDVRKVALHWVVRAWSTSGNNWSTIDYGVHEVHGTVHGSDEGLDLAIKRAILARLEEAKQADYCKMDGEVLPIDLSCVDAGWRTEAVYAACAEAGLGVMPIMGFGRSSGCVQANFSEVQRTTIDRKPGDGYFFSRKGNLWLICADADRWKAWEHDRWMTAPDKPGCMMLFGEPSDNPERLSSDEKSHHAYARHICNEVEVEEPYKGTIRRRWNAKSDNTHWLDASYYADVAAAIKGIKLLSPAKPAPPKTSRKRVRYV